MNDILLSKCMLAIKIHIALDNLEKFIEVQSHRGDSLTIHTHTQNVSKYFLIKNIYFQI